MDNQNSSSNNSSRNCNSSNNNCNNSSDNSSKKRKQHPVDFFHNSDKFEGNNSAISAVKKAKNTNSSSSTVIAEHENIIDLTSDDVDDEVLKSAEPSEISVDFIRDYWWREISSNGQQQVVAPKDDVLVSAFINAATVGSLCPASSIETLITANKQSGESLPLQYNCFNRLDEDIGVIDKAKILLKKKEEEEEIAFQYAKQHWKEIEEEHKQFRSSNNNVKMYINQNKTNLVTLKSFLTKHQAKFQKSCSSAVPRNRPMSTYNKLLKNNISMCASSSDSMDFSKPLNNKSSFLVVPKKNIASSIFSVAISSESMSDNVHEELIQPQNEQNQLQLEDQQELEKGHKQEEKLPDFYYMLDTVDELVQCSELDKKSSSNNNSSSSSNNSSSHRSSSNVSSSSSSSSRVSVLRLPNACMALLADYESDDN